MTTGEETFKSRVQEFWRWFAEAAPRYSQTIAAGACATLTTEISAKVNAIADGLAWEFGPGAGGRGHSLTLSGEGNIEIIKRLMREKGLPAGSSINYFAKDKRMCRIVM